MGRLNLFLMAIIPTLFISGQAFGWGSASFVTEDEALPARATCKATLTVEGKQVPIQTNTTSESNRDDLWKRYTECEHINDRIESGRDSGQFMYRFDNNARTSDAVKYMCALVGGKETYINVSGHMEVQYWNQPPSVYRHTPSYSIKCRSMDVRTEREVIGTRPGFQRSFVVNDIQQDHVHKVKVFLADHIDGKRRVKANVYINGVFVKHISDIPNHGGWYEFPNGVYRNGIHTVEVEAWDGKTEAKVVVDGWNR